MPLAIGFRSDCAEFDSPVALWLAYNERVRRLAARLTHLGGLLDRSEVDAGAQSTATAVGCAFNDAAPQGPPVDDPLAGVDRLQ